MTTIGQELKYLSPKYSLGKPILEGLVFHVVWLQKANTPPKLLRVVPPFEPLRLEVVVHIGSGHFLKALDSHFWVLMPAVVEVDLRRNGRMRGSSIEEILSNKNNI